MAGELLAYVQRFSLKAKRVIYGYMIYELSDHLSKVVIFYLRREEMKKIILVYLIFLIFLPNKAFSKWGSIARSVGKVGQNYSNIDTLSNVNTLTRSIARGSKGLQNTKHEGKISEKEYYPNGNVKLEVINYGKYNKVYSYYENGNVKLEIINYGKYNNAYGYYENGNVEGIGYLIKENNGEINGVITFYTPEGVKDRVVKGTFKDGNYVLEIKTYHKNGNIKLIGTLRNGEYVGVWREYYVDGNLAREVNI